MKKKLKLLFCFFISLMICYEAYYYITFKANSYIGVRGGALNKYKNDFVLILNDENIDTLNVNIPSPFSRGMNLGLGKNTIKLKTLDSKNSFEKEIYFYGLFTWNSIEVTSDKFIFSRDYSVPIIE